MSEPENATLLAEAVERLKSVEAQLDALRAEQAAAFETYAASDNAYREELKCYAAGQRRSAIVDAAQMTFRTLALAVLAYIAFRVSR